MGLDVYLYTAAQAKQNHEYNEASAAWYGEDDESGKPSPHDLATEEERKTWSATHDYASFDNVPSEQYPAHLFNRRYLRSSYNGSGFNNTVPQMLGRQSDLAWIFQPVRLDDQFMIELTAGSVPALNNAKSRALKVADDLRACDRLRVMSIAPNMFREPPKTTDDEALAKYRDAVSTNKIDASSWWGNVDMDVFGDGLQVLAAVPGVATFGIPGVHLIFRNADEGFETYVQSAEICAEFCDEAIALIERDGSCEMSWSG